MIGKKVKVGKAQIKISFILIYYVLMTVTGLVTVIYWRVILTTEVVNFQICRMLYGSDCPLTQDPTVAIYDLTTASIVMVAFLPVVVLLFSIDCKSFKIKLKEWMKKTKDWISTRFSTV